MMMRNLFPAAAAAELACGGDDEEDRPGDRYRVRGNDGKCIQEKCHADKDDSDRADHMMSTRTRARMAGICVIFRVHTKKLGLVICPALYHAPFRANCE